jgi:hypothetical protein
VVHISYQRAIRASLFCGRRDLDKETQCSCTKGNDRSDVLIELAGAYLEQAKSLVKMRMRKMYGKMYGLTGNFKAVDRTVFVLDAHFV